MELLKSVLGAVHENLKAIQSNLANVDTPGYKRSELDFQRVFSELQSNGKLSQPTANYVVTDLRTGWRLDGNNVDPDKEIVTLIETALWYQGISEMLSRHFSTAREVLQMLR